MKFCDVEVDLKCMYKDGVWLSLTDEDTIRRKIVQILDEYVRPDAPTQVCISDAFIKRTMKRITLLSAYGPEIFEEACLDPINTMRKDILPRFLLSKSAEKMVHNLATCEPQTPPGHELKVPPPDSKLLSFLPKDEFSADKRYTLSELLVCLSLYNEFSNYLRKCQASENLICVRMITIFEELMLQPSKVDGSLQAWKIYQFFVAPGSAFEISVHHLDRKRIMLLMAYPKAGMFEHIDHSAREMLKANFDTFSKTDHYKGLGEMMRLKKLNLGKSGGHVHADMVGCFGRIPVNKRVACASSDTSTHS
jgi:hypothetical protein